MSVVTDVSMEKNVEAMVTQVVERFGTVHILINNAGVTIPSSIDEILEKDVEKTVAINIKGIIYCARAVVPNMRRQR
jgi:NADP-dependent 3-hydroxy acid dehydrogenase YdfG